MCSNDLNLNSRFSFAPGFPRSTDSSFSNQMMAAPGCSTHFVADAPSDLRKAGFSAGRCGARVVYLDWTSRVQRILVVRSGERLYGLEVGVVVQWRPSWASVGQAISAQVPSFPSTNTFQWFCRASVTQVMHLQVMLLKSTPS